DGIRDLIVTGVQTCALPILYVGSAFRRPCVGPANRLRRGFGGREAGPHVLRCCKIHERRRLKAERLAATGRQNDDAVARGENGRSEERRVGEEGSGGWWATD